MSPRLYKDKTSSCQEIIIWCFKDGKAGHESQTEGLCAALKSKHSVIVKNCLIKQSLFLFILKLSWFKSKKWPWHGYQKPSLIVGAGHITHLWMLFARVFYGGKIIVLMKPSLPHTFFDTLIVPYHDLNGKNMKISNIIYTKGVLNDIKYSNKTLAARGLILIGGVSKHYYWDEESVLEQINNLLKRNPNIQWEITTSRRTPISTTNKLTNIRFSNSKFTPYSNTDENWVKTRMKIASRVWVTQDSISMIYEALSSGSEIGLISLSSINPSSRALKSIQSLLEEKLITINQKLDENIVKRTKYFNESERCADLILSKLLQ